MLYNSHRQIARAIRVVCVLAAVVLLAACGSTGSQTPKAGHHGSSSATVDAHTGPLGKYLVDSSGKTLYYFASDAPNKSNCYGVCAAGWPILVAKGTPTAGPSVNAAKLGTIKRADGKSQVTYFGLPLYYFVLDANPGNIFGQDLPAFGGLWWMVNPTSGKPITESPPSPAPAAAPTPPSAVTIQAHNGPLGTYLTDSSGKTVYHFDADSTNTPKCTGLCAEVWPPVLISGTPTAGSGITASLLGTATLPDGTMQVTYDQMPLYYFALDGGKAGVTNGQGQKIAGNTWWLISPSGSTINKTIPANGPAAPSPTSSPSSGGY